MKKEGGARQAFLGRWLLLGLASDGSGVGLSLLQDHVGLVVHALLAVVLGPGCTVVWLARLWVDGW